MPRRREVAKRVILPDPKYGDRTVAKLVNILMQDGKKSTAERALYSALDLVSQRTGEEAVKVLKKSLDNIKPTLEVKSRRVGGSTYQVPVEVRAGAADFAGDALADQVCQPPFGENLDRQAGRRNAGCLQQPWRGCQEAGRNAQDGRSQPRFRALPLVVHIVASLRSFCVTSVFIGKNP